MGELSVNQQKIQRLEQNMLAMPEQQVELETRHYFAKGLYCREILIPAGTVLTGKIHRTEHINIVSEGEIVVMTDEGRKHIVAPYTFVAPPGTKRAGFAIRDTRWTTVHPTEETDLDRLEEQLIAPSYCAYLEGVCPGSQLP